MKILAHRGYWTDKAEQNSLRAFERAFTYGFGIETDVRDYCGKLVISHDIASDFCVSLESVFKLYKQFKTDVPLALNVKADGIQYLLIDLIKEYNIVNYFMFDMSVPELVVYIRDNFPSFSRQSEFERNIVMYEQVQGIWIDEFEQNWITEDIIKNHIQNGKQVGIISPEIHQRENEHLWKIVRKYRDADQIMLCTDQPLKAKGFMYEEN